MNAPKEKFYKVVEKKGKKEVAEVTAYSNEQAIYKHAIKESADSVKGKTKTERKKIMNMTYAAMRDLYEAIEQEDPKQTTFLRKDK